MRTEVWIWKICDHKSWQNFTKWLRPLPVHKTDSSKKSNTESRIGELLLDLPYHFTSSSLPVLYNVPSFRRELRLPRRSRATSRGVKVTSPCNTFCNSTYNISVNLLLSYKICMSTRTNKYIHNMHPYTHACTRRYQDQCCHMLNYWWYQLHLSWRLSFHMCGCEHLQSMHTLMWTACFIAVAPTLTLKVCPSRNNTSWLTSLGKLCNILGS